MFSVGKIMNAKTPKPDKKFLETAKLLQELLESRETPKHSDKRTRFENLLKKKFVEAFDLLPDRRKLACNLYYRFVNTEFAPKEKLFDHKDFFQRGENLVIVSQPYGIDENELSRWTKEFGASFTIANEWGYYYPGHAKLFFVEFSPKAKAVLDKLVRNR
jgi:hypothetical protein